MSRRLCSTVTLLLILLIKATTAQLTTLPSRLKPTSSPIAFTSNNPTAFSPALTTIRPARGLSFIPSWGTVTPLAGCMAIVGVLLLAMVVMGMGIDAVFGGEKTVGLGGRRRARYEE